MVPTPKTATAVEHARPGPRRSGIPRQQQRHADGARRRHAAQQAEAPRPDLQDVARVDRQQRHRAAEQHGEEVERDRAEDDRAASG